MEDERLKNDSGSLHVEIKDEKVALRIEAMSLALAGVGSALLDEYLVRRASLIYNFLLDGNVPPTNDDTKPKMYVN